MGGPMTNGSPESQDRNSNAVRPAIADNEVAGRTVYESLAAAEKSGKLVRAGDIGWNLPRTQDVVWMKESRDGGRKCRFYMGVMFEHIYRRQKVPAGCATCYKVKVIPRTLRELLATGEVGHSLPFTYKYGLDEESRYTSGIYGTYFYLHGLEAARAAYKQVRRAVNEHPKLGPDVTVFIKRGCTDYEVHCGPSDQYTFTEEQRELEAEVLRLIQIEPKPKASLLRFPQVMAHWIRTAYRLGDDTYLEFTGGRRLYAASVRYDPESQDTTNPPQPGS
jgi:hypothetical protein